MADNTSSPSTAAADKPTKARRGAGVSYGKGTDGRFDAASTIPAIAPHLMLDDAERVALGVLMSYSRKGALKAKVTITRQQWVEDFLTRGFTRMETVNGGALRIHNDYTGAFYDIRSSVEKRYVKRRHAALHGRPIEVEATPAESPRDTGGVAMEARRQLDFIKGLRSTGVATYRGVSYKVVPVGTSGIADKFQLERTYRGQREDTGEVMDSIEAVVNSATAEAVRFFDHLKALARARRAGGEQKPTPTAAVVIEKPTKNDDPADTEIDAEVSVEPLVRAEEVQTAAATDEVILPVPDATFAPAAETSTPEPDKVAARLAELALGDLDGQAVGRIYAGLREPAVCAHLWPALFGQARALPDNEPDLVMAIRGLVGDQSWNDYLTVRRERKATVKHHETRDKSPRFSYEKGRGNAVTPSGRTVRINANMEAIRLLKKLEAENRPATAEEIPVLALYSGWGADKELFNLQMLGELDRLRALGGDWKAEVAREIKGKASWQKHEVEELKTVLSWYDTYGKHADALKELLTEEEWNAALQSVLNAHYTDGEVCHSLWDIARHAGFRGGRVLEPAVGGGRILAAMPNDLRDGSRIDAVEKDSLSARIAAKLHPDVRVQNAPFEESSVPDGAYDLVITNVPFGKKGPGVQEGLGDIRFNLHNYFIAESFRKLKPGGLGVIISSAATLQNNPDQRYALGKLGLELRGAIRLPSDAFKDGAGTEVVTDILLVRRPSEELVPGGYLWTSDAEVPLIETFYPLNNYGSRLQVPQLDEDGKPVKDQYGRVKQVDKEVTATTVHSIFADQPALALGSHSLAGKMYGRQGEGQYTLVSPKDAPPLVERIAEVIPLLPADLPNPSLTRWLASTEAAQSADAAEEEGMDSSDVIIPDKLEPGLVFKSGSKYYEGRMPPARGVEELAVPANTRASLDIYIELRDRLRELIALDRIEPEPSERSASARARLKDAYDACVLTDGSLTKALSQVQTIIPNEPWMQSVIALETVRQKPGEKGKRPVREYFPAAILTERTVFASVTPARAETLQEAVTQSRAVLGRIDAGFIAGQLGKDAGDPDVCDAVASAVVEAGTAYRLPSDPTTLIPSEQYLSGNLAVRMEDARRAAMTDARFSANVRALEQVIPAPAKWEDVRVPIGAQFVPAHLYGRYLNDVLGFNMAESDAYEMVRLHQPSGRFLIDMKGRMSRNYSRFSNDDLTLEDAVSHALLQTEPKVFTMRDEKRTLDITASDVAKGLVNNLASGWTQWIETHPDAKQEIMEAYHKVFGAYVSPKKTDTSHLVFPGLNSAFKPRAHQLSALADLIPTPCGVVAYNVGFGKTAIGIILAAESRRIGTAKKPMIVCDTANYLQFVTEMRRVYPSAKLLVADDANFSPSSRERFKAQIAYGDHDCVLVSRTQFERIPISAKMEMEWIERELGELRSVQAVMGLDAEDTAPARRGGSKQGKRLARDMAKAIEVKEQKLKALMHSRSQDRGLTWDQLGVDLLIVDEAHRHKKIGIATVHNDIKGVDTGQSKRGFDLLIKARFIQERRNGLGVVGLTGTPCTNTMAEFHTMMKIFAPKVCEDLCVVHFDSFKSAFCKVQEELAMHEASGKWRMEQRLSKFINGKAFISFIRAGMLVEMDSSKLNLNVPKHEKGEIEFEIVPLNHQTLEAMEDIGSIYQEFDKLTGEDKKEMQFVPLMLMQAGMVASIDPRLIRPDLPIAPDGVISKVCENVASIYHDPEHDGAAQVVFLDRYGNMDTSKLDSLRLDVTQAKGMVVIEDDDAPKASGDDDDNEEGEEVEVVAPGKAGRRVNLYKDIRDMLIDKGVPAEQIVLISDVSKKERAAIFDKVNRGEVRVVVGSSDKLGIGANFQKKLYAAHHVDPTRFMTPDGMEQRNGRILRDGNEHSAVRVIYYGMEDTCCPAIYGRIQRKAQFIKQGYAEQGAGAEFEDVSEVRLEELKAALIPDKRAMKLAELKAELADEIRSVDSAERRRGELVTGLSNARGGLDYLSGPGRSRVEARDNWLRDAMIGAVPDPLARDDAEKPVEVDISGLIPRSDELKEWVAANGPVIKGPCKDVVRKLSEMSELIQEVEMDRSALNMPLGMIKLQGIPLNIQRSQVTFASSTRESVENIVFVKDPAASGQDLVKPVRFSTGNPIFKQARLAIFEVEHGRSSNELRIKEAQERLAGLTEDLAKCDVPSRERVEQLRAEVRTIEADMAANPYVRGSGLKGKKTAQKPAESAPVATPEARDKNVTTRRA